jgi:hypothetical protein
MKKPMQILMMMAAAMGAVVGLSGGAVHAEQGSFASAERTALRAARFGISIDGVEVASFTKFDSMVDPSSAAPSRAMTLSGGIGDTTKLTAWHEAVLVGDIVAARKSCSIVMYDADGSPIKRYHLEQAWPAKYTGVSTGGTLRPEAIVIVYESMRID